MAASESKLVAVVMKLDRGGGCSMSSARATVARKASASALGKRCGSVRSVSEATPTGISGSALRSLMAAAFARPRRIVSPSPERASIEREMSITTYASASVRTSSAVSDSATG